MSSITPEFLKKKAREISYALNRVSFYIKRADLRNRVERLSFEFLENVAIASEDASDKVSLIRVFKNISAIDVLVRISHSLYEIETVNSTILLRELDHFNSAIRQLGLPTRDLAKRDNSATANPFAIENLNLESIFSMPPALVPQTVESDNNSATANPFAIENLNLESIFSMPPALVPQTVESDNNSAIRPGRAGQPADSATANQIANIDKEKEIVEKAYSDGQASEQHSSFTSRPIIKKIISESGLASNTGNSAIRQNLILEKIATMGRATVKEMVNQFPGVSERTLRYDLQKLCDRGLVERVGNGGPGTNYIPKKV